jgi:ADP-ribosylglycohydrolase
VGDALGAPTEGMSYNEIRKKHNGKLTKMIPNTTSYTNQKPGSVTDDSFLRYYIALCIIRKGGRITPDDMVKTWRKELNPDRFWINEKIIKHKLNWGMNPWDSGRGGIPAGCASMAIQPVGIINAGDPSQAFQDGFNIASINQDGDDRDFAAAIAAGTAAAFLPDADTHSIIQAVYSCGSEMVKRAVTLNQDIIDSSKDAEEYTENFYKRMLNWQWPLPPGAWKKDNFFSGFSIELVPAALGILHYSKGDVNQAVIDGANFGRDCDTIATIAGSFAGVLSGAGQIRGDWIKTVEENNQDFFEETAGASDANFTWLSMEMVKALRSELENKKKNITLLEKILG